MTKIEFKNIAAIAAALAAVNGTATAHTLVASDIISLANTAEATLEQRGVPKTHRTGAAYTYSPAGPGAARYKFAAISTFVKIIRRSGGWYLDTTQRVAVYPRQKEHRCLIITDTQQQAIISHALRGTITKAAQSNVAITTTP